MAAGRGTRLRPLTNAVAKPVLPIDGRPVIGSLLRELSAGGCPRATVVTGHLAAQVEALVGDDSAWGVEVRFVAQPSPDGSADAVRRAGLEPPYLVCAADTLFSSGDVGRFSAAFQNSRAAGALGIRIHAGKAPVTIADGLVTRVVDPDGTGPWSAAPLWAVGPEVHGRLCLDERPYELGAAFQSAIDAGHEVLAVEVGPTRDLTEPLDLLRENFPYLKTIT